MDYQFESKVEIDNEKYSAELSNILFRKRSKRKPILRLAPVLIIGIGMLFWKYTMSLGIVLLLFIAISFFMMKVIKNQKWLDKLSNDRYRENIIIHSPLFYGFNEFGFTVRGKYFNANAAWHLVYSYNNNGKWVRVFVPGLITLYYSVPEMKEQGVFDFFISKVELNGKKIDF